MSTADTSTDAKAEMMTALVSMAEAYADFIRAEAELIKAQNEGRPDEALKPLKRKHGNDKAFYNAAHKVFLDARAAYLWPNARA